jgi:hypothetical protein
VRELVEGDAVVGFDRVAHLHAGPLHAGQTGFDIEDLAACSLAALSPLMASMVATCCRYFSRTPLSLASSAFR